MLTTDREQGRIPNSRIANLNTPSLTLNPRFTADLHTGKISVVGGHGAAQPVRRLTVKQCEALYWSQRLCRCAAAVSGKMRITSAELLDIMRPLTEDGFVRVEEAGKDHDCRVAEPAQTLSVLWHEAVKRHSARPLIIHDDCGILTYFEAEDIVSALAARLLSAGIGKGDRVAVYSPMHPEAILLFWAAAHLGAVFVPLDSTLPQKALEPLIEAVNPSIVFCSPASRNAISGLGKASCVVFDGTGGCPAPPASSVFSSWLNETEGGCRPDPAVGSDDAAVILFTSGSTGAPKGVVLSHGALYRSAALMAQAYNWRPEDVLISLGELHTMSGLRNPCVAALHAGCSFVISAPDRRINALAVGEDIRRRGATIISTVPAMLRQLIRFRGRIGRKTLSALRFVLSTGSTLPETLIEEFRSAYGLPVYNYYGLTETAGLCIGVLPDIPEPANETIGIPLDCIARIANSRGETLNHGEVGELHIYSANLMSCYYRDRGRTEGVLTDGWLFTGDLAYRRADNAVVLAGRMDETFKDDRGEFISPSEIERTLELHRRVAEAAVCSYEAPEGGRLLAAFIVPDVHQADTLELIDELRRHILNLLGPRKAPHRFFVTEALPRGSNGKILRKKLKERCLEDDCS